MKKILGLDLGTNSIGWAVIGTDDNYKPTEIINAGSRIIPMDAGAIGDFNKGTIKTQTSERTRTRGVRRLRERELLRRERLHRVLNILGFLPVHYARSIGWDKNDKKTYGKFINNAEPKLAWSINENGKYEFLFKSSFEEMLREFSINQPQLVENDKKIPYDWTIYYLRKKALSEKITKEELAWIILNFNQKRGYYQLRGEDENTDKIREYVERLKVVQIEKGDVDKKNNNRTWYNIKLENDWVYSATFTTEPNWLNQIKEFLITEELDEDGSIKIIKDKKSDTTGKEKRKISILPSFEEIELMSQKDKDKIFNKIKVKTELTII
ncbi:MAG: type II CRISPR RNA-guided endonuclease Cas9 [Bacteroidales bacterium]